MRQLRRLEVIFGIRIPWLIIAIARSSQDIRLMSWRRMSLRSESGRNDMLTFSKEVVSTIMVTFNALRRTFLVCQSCVKLLTGLKWVLFLRMIEFKYPKKQNVVFFSRVTILYSILVIWRGIEMFLGLKIGVGTWPWHTMGWQMISIQIPAMHSTRWLLFHFRKETIWMQSITCIEHWRSRNHIQWQQAILKLSLKRSRRSGRVGTTKPRPVDTIPRPWAVQLLSFLGSFDSMQNCTKARNSRNMMSWRMRFSVKWQYC